ncbi:MAG: DNA-directed RNA polymerase subunit omega [Clostridiales bacterium]|nr:DNA-directed RNA polymerase subunit omega [Clostridiales bacterium]
MILYPMNELLTNVESRYELVNLVAHRARELSEEAEESEEPMEEKPVTVALNEARAGTLVPKEKEKEE